mgnify:CR=1 FL=1|jgi:hypothetical protein
MAQETSELWKTLWRMENTSREYAFDISGTWYGPESEVSHSVENSLYAEFSIGNATTAKLSLSLYAENIPFGAVIKRYVRLVNGNQTSEWIPKGIFFTSRRSMEDGLWNIEAFDSMRKAETVWKPDSGLVFPMTMEDTVELLAGLMGVEIDPRTSLDPSYTIESPGDTCTFRQILQWIGAAHGGNWIISDEGKLLLVPLISMPEETNYLIEERGDAITFGGDRILVG